MKRFLASLDRERLLALLEGELADRIGECEIRGSAQPELRYRGLSREELAALLQKFFPSALEGAREDPVYTIPGSLPAVVLDFPELRLSASVDAAASRLLLDKRGELAAALLGDGGTESSAGESAGQGSEGGRP
jgi:hypothetical protein